MAVNRAAHSAAAPRRRSRLERAGLVYLYVALYVLLDWVSLIQPFALGIAPWNPPAGLCLAMLLREGTRFLPATIVALALSETLFRGLPLFAPETIGTVLAIALVYAAAARALRRIAPGVLELATHRCVRLVQDNVVVLYPVVPVDQFDQAHPYGHCSGRGVTTSQVAPLHEPVGCDDAILESLPSCLRLGAEDDPEPGHDLVGDPLTDDLEFPDRLVEHQLTDTVRSQLLDE